MTDSLSVSELSVTAGAVAAAAAPLAVQRVRHLLKARLVDVRAVQRLGPHFVRVTFGGAELHDLISASFDDHVKLMLPADPDAAPLLPVFDGGRPDGEPGPGARLHDSAPRPLMRDYTPRRVDTAAGELDIEFVLHGDGPAAAWAAQARVGQQVGIGGPRGSLVVPTGFAWHLLIGDETALPAIDRRLEELPAGVQAIVIVELGDAADRRPLTSRAELALHWCGREPGSAALLQALRRLELPAGDGYAWAAGEAHAVAAVRELLVGTHGLPKERVRAAAYWKHGDAGHHRTLGD